MYIYIRVCMHIHTYTRVYGLPGQAPLARLLHPRTAWLALADVDASDVEARRALIQLGSKSVSPVKGDLGLL